MDEALRERWLAYVDRRLSGPGRRSGAARNAVIELLAREGQCLLTAQEIIDRLRPRGSPSSVYRALDELHALGLLHRLDGRYEIVDPERRHHHLIDESSGAVQPFVDEDLERAVEAVADRLGVQLTGHDVILRGRYSPAQSAQ